MCGSVQKETFLRVVQWFALASGLLRILYILVFHRMRVLNVFVAICKTRTVLCVLLCFVSYVFAIIYGYDYYKNLK